MGSGSGRRGERRKTELNFETRLGSAPRREAEHLARRDGGWREPWRSPQVQNEAQSAIKPPDLHFNVVTC